MYNCCKWFCRHFTLYLKTWLIFFIPLLLLPLPIIINTKEAKTGYVILLVAIYWMTAVLPLAVTSLLPIALLPLLDVQSTNDVCSAYFKGPNVVCFASVALALGFQQSRLHTRIAYRTLLLVGVDPKWLLMAFMSVTMMMSMWISNMAVTAMLLPIAGSVLQEIFDEEKEELPVTDLESRSSSVQTLVVLDPADVINKDQYKKNVQSAIYLSIAFTCSISSPTTMINAGALVLEATLDGLYPDNSLSFPTFMALAVPIALINTLLTWFWLCFLFIGFRSNKKFLRDPDAFRLTLRRELKSLGPVTFHQVGIAGLYGLLIFLWFFRNPQFIPGWASLLPNGALIGDATPGILILFAAFIIPSDLTNWRSNRKSLLDWDHTQKNFPWSALLLFGGGYALSESSKASGLSDWLGHQLAGMNALPPMGILVLACLITSVVTQVSSNQATAAIFVPILAKLAGITGKNPLYLMIPAVINCSYAFLLAAGTPSNAVVLTAGKMDPSVMLRAGIMVNIYCTSVSVLMTITVGDVIFDWDSIPDWMDPHNATLTTFIPSVTH